MNNLPIRLFEANNMAVRTTIKDGDVWFVAKDVCDIIGIKNSRDALSALDDDERGFALFGDLYGRSQNTAIINESGLYSLIFKSRKPEAKAFRIWVTSEVLPTIRREYMNALIVKGIGLCKSTPKVDGYFYIYDFGHIIKIGISAKSPDTRLEVHVRDLRKFELDHTLENKFVARTPENVGLERAVKQHFSDKSTDGSEEWLREVTFTEVREFVEGYLSAKEGE